MALTLHEKLLEFDDANSQFQSKIAKLEFEMKFVTDFLKQQFGSNFSLEAVIGTKFRNKQGSPIRMTKVEIISDNTDEDSFNYEQQMPMASRSRSPPQKKRISIDPQGKTLQVRLERITRSSAISAVVQNRIDGQNINSSGLSSVEALTDSVTNRIVEEDNSIEAADEDYTEDVTVHHISSGEESELDEGSDPLELKSSNEKIKCDWPGCNKVLSALRYLKEHKTLHTGKLHKCDWPDCDRSYTEASGLNYHKRIHTDKPYKCDWPNCKRIFYKTSSDLDAHIAISHARHLPCKWPNCDKVFSTSTNLKLHQYSHTGERPFKCDWPNCARSFTSLRDLNKHKKKIHIRTNTERIPCDWPDCNKSYLHQRELKLHKLSHTGKPFKCDWENCTKSYAEKRELVVHTRAAHTGERPFKCDVENCNKSFVSNKNLKVHKKFHIKLKCNVPNCGVMCNGKLELLKHNKVCHKETFFCEVCGKQLRDSYTLKLHKKKAHKIGLEIEIGTEVEVKTTV